MASEHFVNTAEDWNDIFLTRDLDGNEDEASEDESDPDYDEVMVRMTPQSDSEDEDEAEVGPAIELHNTQILRDHLQGKSLVGPIKHLLVVMDGMGINLPIFLDALSWGDPECIQDAKIWYARSALMNSKELPGILQRWWKPPRSSGSKKKRPRGAGPVMENFAAECTQSILNRELEAIATQLVSPAGEDIKEETLTSLIFEEMIIDMMAKAPTLWKLLRSMAYTSEQQKRNTEKNPDKVSCPVYQVDIMKSLCSLKDCPNDYINAFVHTIPSP
jgi:hypothetical protein